MICPKCKELNQKSTIHCRGSSTTLMYCPPYFDEDGKFHSHNSNSCTTEYSCSKGHKIIVTPSNKCPNCDFGHDEVITTQDLVFNGTVIGPSNFTIGDN